MTAQILGDRYEIQHTLGKRPGRYTFLARDRVTQDQVVIKLLKFGEDFEWEHLKLFEREAQILKNLFHPAIPRYLDSFEYNTPQSTGFAFVQTYIDALSLQTHLKAGRTFSTAEIQHIARSLLEILQYLHERQPPVIHRDLKPSNILLHPSDSGLGQLYLVDFGSVQTLAATTGGTLTVVGTYGYMPPEQFGGRTIPASDLYGLGATLIYLATGMHPADLPQQDLRIQFEHLAQLSPALVNWLRCMSEPSLNRRFSSAAEALRALNQLSQTALSTTNPAFEAGPLAGQPPSGSKVRLTKDVETFRLTIPPMGWNPGLIFLGLFAIAWNTFITFWTYMAVFVTPFPINLLAGIFSLPFWGAGLSMAGMVLFSLFGKLRLQIDPRRISLVYHLFGFNYHSPKPMDRREIYRIERIGRSFTKDSDGDRVEVAPQLIIWAGTHKYEVGSHNLLSEPELDWLATELSDWLGLPITHSRNP